MSDRPPIYLDHNATTPLLPEVVDAMLPYLRESFGNPSSGHVYGRRARHGVETARERVAELLGCEPDEVIFTSGGTEANNLAIRGVADAMRDKRYLLTSSIEHPAVAEPCAYLAEHGWTVQRIDVDESGRVRVDELEGSLRADTALVTVMHSNNETGTVQPIAEIARLAHARGAIVHTDAAQSVGKVRVNVRELGVDLLSVAGHKLYAQKGVGALYVKGGTPLRPFARGGGHEHGLRPGTENVASIVGLGVACKLAEQRLADAPDAVRHLRDRLWDGLSAGIPDLALNGHGSQRLPNTLNVRFPGALGSEVLACTPEIAASTGSACHDGGETASAVLLAMRLSPEEALGAVRLTLGVTTTEGDVAEAIDALIRGWKRARGDG